MPEDYINVSHNDYVNTGENAQKPDLPPPRLPQRQTPNKLKNSNDFHNLSKEKLIDLVKKLTIENNQLHSQCNALAYRNTHETNRLSRLVSTDSGHESTIGSTPTSPSYELSQVRWSNNPTYQTLDNRRKSTAIIIENDKNPSCCLIC